VELCDKYSNPDYVNRLHVALANELYWDCEHKCVYDYYTYKASEPYAFKWEERDACFTVVSGNYCVVSEKAKMHEVHIKASLMCETPFECVPRSEWSEDKALENCPDGYGPGGGDKGWGTAKLCENAVWLDDGFYKKVYEESFNSSLANFIYWSCSSRCVYDINNPTIAYKWEPLRGCWRAQTKWSCFTGRRRREYEWAVNYVAEGLCHQSAPAPETFTCIERVQDWNEEIALSTCSTDEDNPTDKSHTASVCYGYDGYQYRLDQSLANRMFMSCRAWCVYDIFSEAEEAFSWNRREGCWKPVTRGDCLDSALGKRNTWTMKDYISNILCESTTPEPTVQPTCTSEVEWSEALMDSHCTVAETGSTYKHYESIGKRHEGRRPVPCSGDEDNEYDLLKSLAMRLFKDCSSWCVYDFPSGAEKAWKWKTSGLCWELVNWGSCHWDYTKDVIATEWTEFKAAVQLVCTHAPSVSPTDCMPKFEWDEARASELCGEDHGSTNKGFGATVCTTDDVSVTKQESLDESLANAFYKHCSSTCVYDYDTVINNIRTGSSEQGGFIWKSARDCWKWVEEDYPCFTSGSDFHDVSVYAEGECDVQF